jgi:hypothetical protein
MTASDTLGGIASIASKVDYLIYGFVAGVPTRLASGQLSDSSAILYTAPSAAHVISVSFVNTHTSAVSIDLFLDPLNAGTPRRAIPKTLVLQAGYSLYFDGQRCMMIDTSGGIVSGGNVSDEEYGANWDGVTSVSPSKNAVYDQMQLKLTGSYATAAEIIAGEETAEAIAPDQAALSLVGAGSTLTDNALLRGDGGERKAQTSTVIVDDSGRMTNSSQPGFSVYPTIGQDNIAVGSAVTVVWGTEIFDQNANFATNVFTAPVTGKYQMNVSLYMTFLDSGASYYSLTIVTSNRSYSGVFDMSKFSADVTYWTFEMSRFVDMDAGDTAYITITQVGGAQQSDISTGSSFSGFLVF